MLRVVYMLQWVEGPEALLTTHPPPPPTPTLANLACFCFRDGCILTKNVIRDDIVLPKVSFNDFIIVSAVFFDRRSFTFGLKVIWPYIILLLSASALDSESGLLGDTPDTSPSITTTTVCEKRENINKTIFYTAS